MRAKMRSECERSASPERVKRTVFPSLSNNFVSRVCSRALIEWLIADWVKLKDLAAAVKLPCLAKA